MVDRSPSAVPPEKGPASRSVSRVSVVVRPFDIVVVAAARPAADIVLELQILFSFRPVTAGVPCARRRRKEREDARVTCLTVPPLSGYDPPHLIRAHIGIGNPSATIHYSKRRRGMKL